MVSVPSLETTMFGLLDGSVLEVTAPVGALSGGAVSHTVVKVGRVVENVETGERSFGGVFLSDLTNAISEPYRGGDLISGELDGPRALIWMGERYSLLLAYDGISSDDARAVVEALDFSEEEVGIVAMGGVAMEGMTMTVPLAGGGYLEIEPFQGPPSREITIGRGASGEVTSISVIYPTAKANVYVPPFRTGASFIDLIGLIDVRWED